VSIREGCREGIATFYDLMQSICRRQGVAPMAPDVGGLASLWDAARPVDCARLYKSEVVRFFIGNLLSLQYLKRLG